MDQELIHINLFILYIKNVYCHYIIFINILVAFVMLKLNYFLLIVLIVVTVLILLLFYSKKPKIKYKNLHAKQQYNNFSSFLNQLAINNVNDINPSIIYIPHLNAGLCNKLMGYYSSAYLALGMNLSYYISCWDCFRTYFQIPSILFDYNCDSDEIIHFNGSIFREKDIEIVKQHETYIISTVYDLLESFVEICEKNQTKWFHCYSLDIEYRFYDTVWNLRRLIQYEFLHPVKSIRNTIQKFYKIKKSSIILGIHIRFHEKFFNNYIWHLYIHKTLELLEKYKNLKLYVISDNEGIYYDFISIFKEYIIKYKIPGLFIHVGKTIFQPNNISVIKSISENFVLSLCDFIMGSCGSTYLYLALNRFNKKYIMIPGLFPAGRAKLYNNCNYFIPNTNVIK